MDLVHEHVASHSKTRRDFGCVLSVCEKGYSNCCDRARLLVGKSSGSLQEHCVNTRTTLITNQQPKFLRLVQRPKEHSFCLRHLNIITNNRINNRLSLLSSPHTSTVRREGREKISDDREKGCSSQRVSSPARRYHLSKQRKSCNGEAERDKQLSRCKQFIL